MKDGDWTLRFIESRRSRVVAVWASAALITLAFALVIIAGNESPTVSATPVGAVSHGVPTALPAPRSVPRHRKHPTPSTSPVPTAGPSTQPGASGGIVVITYSVMANNDSKGLT